MKKAHGKPDVPFSQRSPDNRWLKNAQIADVFGVDVRTIKRWMAKPETREALRAIRHGKQWRVGYPGDLEQWKSETRWRLKAAGVKLTPEWQRQLRTLGKKSSRYRLDLERLWLACYATVLTRSRITTEAIEAIILIRQSAAEILKLLPWSEMTLEKLKQPVAGALRKRFGNEARVRRIMRRWPNRRTLEKMRALNTLKDVETFRRKLDFLQAARELKHRRENPTQENLKRLLHKNLITHVNGTGEELPGIVVRCPTPKQLHQIAMRSVYAQMMGKKPPIVTLDFRRPQTGLALRTTQQRHPMKKQTQRDMITGVYRIRAKLPSADEKVHTGQTPVRSPADDSITLGRLRARRRA